ncbi:hypothetical protein [Rufibacter hautae]|uniref:DUF4595 domain-containing protein n=1 Tax=Rufibacter hautae TaxID=2595005 RepID=A0A5B6TLF8_9BACT|nr:hypothetical protein [Rufibacter hautae]KAA3440269.1 hypothetical protein FOA19_06330 [Rufibacter hautae]
MRYTLLLFCVLAPLIFLSCSDDELGETGLLLTRVQIYNVSQSKVSDFEMAYSKEGLLVHSNPEDVHHEYDREGRLTKVLSNRKEELLAYDASGRLASSITREEFFPDDTHQYTFTYDATGILTRVLIRRGESHPVYQLVVLSYDGLGNVTKEDWYASDASGNPLRHSAVLEAAFDSNPNPMRGVGGFGHHFYYSTTTFTFFFTRFVPFLSPNNPIWVKSTQFKGPSFDGSEHEVKIHYKYNGRGYPSEVMVNGYLQELEYKGFSLR